VYDPIHLHGAITSSFSTDLLSNFVSAQSSSYITTLKSNDMFNTLTGLWTLTTASAIILNDSGVSHIDGISPSVITMSCQNCNLTSLQQFNPTIPYKLAYLDISNNDPDFGINDIEDVSVLPISMSYLNFQGNANLRSFGSTLPKGLKYLNVANCGLSTDDLDELTSMVYSEISASNITNGTLDITGNGFSTLPGGYTNTFTWYNISQIIVAPYNWTVNYIG